MSLDLTNAPLIPEEETLGLMSAFDILKQVEEYIEEEVGVPPPRRPNTDIPDMSDIADKADELSTLELEKGLARFTAWASYMSAKLANVIAAHKIAERNRKAVDAQLSLDLFSKGTPKTEVVERVRASTKHLEFELEELKLYAMKQALNSRHAAASSGSDTVSRLITLRGQEVDKSSRTTTIYKKKPKGPSRASRRKTGYR